MSLDPFRAVRSRVSIGLLVVLGLVSAHLATLQTYPLPGCDETAYADSAYSLVTRGRPSWSAFPEPDRFGRHINVVHQGRTYLLGLGTMLLALGRTLFVARLHSLIGGLLAVGLTFVVGRKLYGARVGALAALVFATSFKLFLTAHTGRPESWATAAILASFYLILHADTARPSALFMTGVGLVVALTLDVHFNALAFVAAWVVLVLWRLGWRERDARSVLCFSIGLGLGGLLWVAVHAWPSPIVAWQQLTGYSVAYTGLHGSGAGPGPWLNPLSMLAYFRSAYVDVAWPAGLIEAGLAGLGVGLALYRRSRADRTWLTVLGISILAFAGLFSQRFIQYSVLWTPLALLGGFAAADALATRLSRGNPRLARAGLVGLAVSISLIQIAGNGWLVHKFRGSNFTDMEARLAELVPPGARVLADGSWWWALKPNRVFMSDQYLLAEAPAAEEPAGDSRSAVRPWIARLMARLRPDYVLVDGALDCASDPGAGWTELRRYLASHCEPIADLAGAWVDDPRARTHLLGQTTSVYRCPETAPTAG